MCPLVYLASGSPRRQELLRQLGVRHEVLRVSVDERPLAGELPENYARRLALAKARAGRAAAGESGVRVLGADTAVVIDQLILGKPRDRAEGLAMLARLAGRTHRVLTAVALIDDAESVLLNTSRVSFRAIGDSEAAAYWASGEPKDKAGGYAIQGLGAMFVSRLEGSFSGVVGLPLFETAALLRRSGVDILQLIPSGAEGAGG